jgi:hypothetical protein
MHMGAAAKCRRKGEESTKPFVESDTVEVEGDSHVQRRCVPPPISSVADPGTPHFAASPDHAETRSRKPSLSCFEESSTGSQKSPSDSIRDDDCGSDTCDEILDIMADNASAGFQQEKVHGKMPQRCEALMEEASSHAQVETLQTQIDGIDEALQVQLLAQSNAIAQMRERLDDSTGKRELQTRMDRLEQEVMHRLNTLEGSLQQNFIKREREAQELLRQELMRLSEECQSRLYAVESRSHGGLSTNADVKKFLEAHESHIHRIESGLQQKLMEFHTRVLSTEGSIEGLRTEFLNLRLNSKGHELETVVRQRISEVDELCKAEFRVHQEAQAAALHRAASDIQTRSWSRELSKAGYESLDVALQDDLNARLATFEMRSAEHVNGKLRDLSNENVAKVDEMWRTLRKSELQMHVDYACLESEVHEESRSFRKQLSASEVQTQKAVESELAEVAKHLRVKQSEECLEVQRRLVGLEVEAAQISKQRIAEAAEAKRAEDAAICHSIGVQVMGDLIAWLRAQNLAMHDVSRLSTTDDPNWLELFGEVRKLMAAKYMEGLDACRSAEDALAQFPSARKEVATQLVEKLRSQVISQTTAGAAASKHTKPSLPKQPRKVCGRSNRPLSASHYTM